MKGLGVPTLLVSFIARKCLVFRPISTRKPFRLKWKENNNNSCDNVKPIVLISFKIKFVVRGLSIHAVYVCFCAFIFSLQQCSLLKVFFYLESFDIKASSTSVHIHEISWFKTNTNIWLTGVLSSSKIPYLEFVIRMISIWLHANSFILVFFKLAFHYISLTTQIYT